MPSKAFSFWSVNLQEQESAALFGQMASAGHSGAVRQPIKLACWPSSPENTESAQSPGGEKVSPHCGLQEGGRPHQVQKVRHLFRSLTFQTWSGLSPSESLHRGNTSSPPGGCLGPVVSWDHGRQVAPWAAGLSKCKSKRVLLAPDKWLQQGIVERSSSPWI